jgi:hypothetical protein
MLVMILHKLWHCLNLLQQLDGLLVMKLQLWFAIITPYLHVKFCAYMHIVPTFSKGDNLIVIYWTFLAMIISWCSKLVVLNWKNKMIAILPLNILLFVKNKTSLQKLAPPFKFI